MKAKSETGNLSIGSQNFGDSMQFAKHIKTTPAVRYPYTHLQILIR